MLTLADLPERLNLASWFVDRNVEEGGGERTALITPDGPVSYRALAERVNRIGQALLELGVRPGERVLLVLADGLDFVAAWYATQKVGAVTAEAYTFLASKDLEHLLELTGARVVLTDAVAAERVRAAVREAPAVEHVVLCGEVEASGAGERRLEELIEGCGPDLEAHPTHRDDIAIWKFTTGSTGRPKAAVHPVHSAVLSSEWYSGEVLEMAADDLVLPVPKLFFGYARDLVALFPFRVGAAGLVYPERPTPELLFELIERHRPTVFVQVPTMMAAMLEHPAAAERDLSSLRLCTSAGEALPAPLQRRWTETFGVEVLDGIGSSEAYHIYISNRPGRVREGSLGELVPGYSARVERPDGSEAADGEAGELVVSGDTAALLYWRNRASSSRTFAGGAVRTGDLVKRSADGYFSYEGRVDDLLKIGGIWVAPREVETALGEHAAVRRCAVVGVAADGLTRPVAFVVLAPGHERSEELAGALQQHVRDTLSPHKYPREVRFVDAIPTNPSGKVDRKALARG